RLPAAGQRRRPGQAPGPALPAAPVAGRPVMLHPWMLLGLIGLSVPIIIHLIQRQRLRTQPLATLQFLDIEDAANAFAPVPRDWLQLLLRLTLLGLFILL